MIPPARWPRVASTLYRTFGARGGALRTVHEVRRAGGWFRTEPRHASSFSPAPAAHPFAVDAARLRAATDASAAVARGNRVAGGEHQAYRAEWRPLPRTPDAWLAHPRTGAAFGGTAWWAVHHLDAAMGDIKDVWEPGRFGWVYDLVRAWLVTGDDRYARAFHQRFAEWHASSPPFQGPHWGCGQETSIRAVALLYAEAGLAGAPSSTPEAMGRIAGTLAASGERVADALGYAVSQRNNHAVSEAMGLVVLGHRLRGAHPEAAGWLARGRRTLERLVREQFGEDGWYVQHSLTYLRVSLDQLVVAQRSLRAAGLSLSGGAVARVRAAVEMLGALADPRTGIVPNHGANDGALVHPVTLAPYRDFRPLMTAAAATFGLPLPPGIEPDAEVCAWLDLPVPAAGPAVADGVRSGSGGWASARVGAAAVFLRAGRYRTRPGHLDPLQLDVRFGGREIVVDAGTFAYNGPAPWRNGLVWGRVHNAPLLDGAEPGVRGPRFLWYLWPEADLLRARMEGAAAVLAGEIPGRVRREVTVAADEVTVVDTALAAAGEMTVRWLLHPDADPACVQVEGGAVLHQAAEGDVLGWFSPHYGERIASRWWEVVRGPVTPGTRIVTRIRRPAG